MSTVKYLPKEHHDIHESSVIESLCYNECHDRCNLHMIR